MSRLHFLSRRTFLTDTCAAVAALGTGVIVGQNLFADRPQIASRIAETPMMHPLTPALKMGTDAMEALEAIDDYQAIFTKREMINRKLQETRMELKLREKPFSVYLKFIQPHAGREVLYVAGNNDGKLQVHDVGIAGLAGTISLDPEGKYAMADNRYPVTMIGMRTLVTQVLEQWLDETSADDLSVNLYPNARIGQTACKAIESSHASPQSGAKFHMTRLYIEQEHGLPVRVQQYDFPKGDMKPVLVEDYLYSDLKLNPGFQDIDFSTKNPKYRF